MPLKTGVYNIRWVPKHIKLPFVGGVYATGDTLNEPVRAEALNPSATGNQQWRVAAIEGKEGIYQISYPGIVLAGSGENAGNSPIVTSWATTKRGSDIEPVILRGHIAEWLITVVDEENSIYRIAEPHGPVVGSVRYVTEEHDLLYVKSYPFFVGSEFSLPSWQFVPSRN